MELLVSDRTILGPARISVNLHPSLTLAAFRHSQAKFSISESAECGERQYWRGAGPVQYAGTGNVMKQNKTAFHSNRQENQQYLEMPGHSQQTLPRSISKFGLE